MITLLLSFLFSLILPIYAGYNGLGLKYAFIYGGICSLVLIWKSNALQELRAKLAGRQSNLTYWIFALPLGMAVAGSLIGVTNSLLYSLVAWLAGQPIRW